MIGKRQKLRRHRRRSKLRDVRSPSHACQSGGFIARCWLHGYGRGWCVFKGSVVVKRAKSLAKMKSFCARVR